MTEVIGEDVQLQTENFFSLEEVLDIISYSGVNSLHLWDKLLELLRNMLLEDLDLSSYELYQKLKYIITIFRNHNELIPSERLLSSSEIIDVVNPYISNDLSARYYAKSLVQTFKLKALEAVKKINNEIAMDSDSDNNSEINESDDDEFSKIFDSIKTNDKQDKKQKKISQVISIVSNDNQKLLSTPGEWGSHLIKIEVTNTCDLKGIPKDEYWKKVSQKAVFLVKSSNDENYRKIIKILQSVAKHIASINNVKKIAKKVRHNNY